MEDKVIFLWQRFLCYNIHIVSFVYFYKEGCFVHTEDLVEIRIHGRGGQGAVFAATLAAEIAPHGLLSPSFSFLEQKEGCPGSSFYVTAGLPHARCRIYEPFCVVVFDAALPKDAVVDGLKGRRAFNKCLRRSFGLMARLPVEGNYT